MSKYFKFGVDTFNVFFEKWAILKFLHGDDNDNNDDDDLAIRIARLFLQNRRYKMTEFIILFYS